MSYAIHDKVQAYYGDMVDAHDRYRSWEHCYRFFSYLETDPVSASRDHAALQLGFYLASWGMYRGSSFLLQYAYTAHLGVVDVLASPKFSALRRREFGASGSDLDLIPTILEAVAAVRDAYRPFAPPTEARQASDTLVTKVLLGTLGCLPACDRYFIDGVKSAGLRYSYVNASFVERIFAFCADNLRAFRDEQEAIERVGGIRYPLMKLVDMYFWETGYERDVAVPQKAPGAGYKPL